MTRASDNAFPSILITEGTEPSAPAAGKQRLYIDSTSHKLKATNSSGTERDIEGIADQGTLTYVDYTEAAAPSTPASGKVRLYAKSDGLLYSKDDAGSESAVSGTGGGGIVGHDEKRYTGGDIALTSTSQAAVSGPTDLSVTAATGDLLMVGVSATPVSAASNSIAFEFATIVSAAANRYIGAQSSTPINVPVQMWFIAANEATGVGGAFPYVVDASDVSGGTVTLRLYARVSGNRSINADASNPLDTWVVNMGQ